MAFDISPSSLKDVVVLKHKLLSDNRGAFSRLFCSTELNSILQDKSIVQINHSITKKKGSIRGLHFQHPPYAETKFVKVLKGAVYDVALNTESGAWTAEVLSAENQKILMIPEGYAHGFQSLENNTELLYLHTAPYNPEYEAGINPFDPKINITWPLEVAEYSKRDYNLPLFDEVKNNGM